MQLISTSQQYATVFQNTTTTICKVLIWPQQYLSMYWTFQTHYLHVFFAMLSRLKQTRDLPLRYTTVNIYYSWTIHHSLLFQLGLINFTVLEVSYTICNGMESSTITNVVTECVSITWTLFVFVLCDIDSSNADCVLWPQHLSKHYFIVISYYKQVKW